MLLRQKIKLKGKNFYKKKELVCQHRKLAVKIDKFKITIW
jgi:hypothetical protein